MLKRKGPTPNPLSISNQGARQTFYIKEDLIRRLDALNTINPTLSKSLVVNEALGEYLDKLQIPSDERIKIVSLFSGCGGMDLGFRGNFTYLGNKYEDLGFDIVFANDIFKEACLTYERYFEHYPVTQDIKEYLDFGGQIPKCHLVIGGFPCQDFSVSGKRKGLNSERGRLYEQMKRVIEIAKPCIFIAENVKGLTNMGDVLEKIKNDFSQLSPEYEIDHFLLMAADFGVPQTRERVFIVGTRKDLKVSFYPPTPTHAADQYDSRKPWVTAKQAIDDLWGLETTDKIPNQNQFSKARNYGEHLQGNKPIKPDFPSPTIRAEHHGNIEFHYNNSRRLTVRECARLQSFPDDFVFYGSGSRAYVQVGNAVPPVLAWHIAKQVKDYFERLNKKDKYLLI
ncbi:MAG: DNA cytosine methyltransferase [Clostridia bacterium]|nr:DNA cytosine methyltransferase [Clostridia bacterium]